MMWRFTKAGSRDPPLLDPAPDGVVPDATDEGAAGIEDVLEQLVLRVAAIDHLQPPCF